MGNCLSCAGRRVRDVERQPLLGGIDSSGTITREESSPASPPNSHPSPTPRSSLSVSSETSPSSPKLGLVARTGRPNASSSSSHAELVSGLVEGTRQPEVFNSITHDVNQLVSASRTLGSVRNDVQGVRGDIAVTRAEVAGLSEQVAKTAEQTRQRSNIERLPLVPGASYDQSLGCMDDTRTAIIEEAVRFLTKEDVGEMRIFLLHGCAGSGKTTIAHSVARMCEQEHQCLGGSFFFKAGQNLLDTPVQLISTLARDLSSRNCAYASQLSETIESNASITRAPLANQFQSLLLHPFSQIASQSRPVAFVIDAIDEGWSEQLLPVLKTCSKLPSWVRLFITLRDDGLILPRLRTQTHIIQRDVDISTESNIHDVRVYVKERLCTIASDRELENWPSDEAVDRMCAKADGLFVWAAVACNSIADVDLDPLEQFEELVSGGPLRDTRASSQIDSLYLKVLSKCRLDEPRALSRYHECLGGLLVLKRPLSISAMDRLLNTTYTLFTFRPLSSIIRGLMNQRLPIQIIHTSFREFVTKEVADTSSSKKYMIVPSEHNETLALRCLNVIKEEMPTIAEYTRWIVDEERDIESSVPELGDDMISEALWYSCEYVMEHIDAVVGPVPGLAEAIGHFVHHDVYGWLAVCAMKGQCQRIEKLQRCWQIKRDEKVATEPAQLTQTMLNLSESLRYDNRVEEALVTASSAVSLCCALSVDTEDSKELTARAFHALSIYMSVLGQHEEALRVVTECVLIRRDLARDRPAACNPALAGSLNLLSYCLFFLGRNEEGLVAVTECVDLLRALASDQPGAFNPSLASSLSTLSAHLEALGHHEEALVTVRECVDLYRALASDRPAAFSAHLAMSLNSLSNQLSHLGHHEQALAAVTECVAMRRNLASNRPAVFNPKLAKSLYNLAMSHRDAHNLREAIASCKEAELLYRPFAERFPLVYQSSWQNSCNLLDILEEETLQTNPET